MKKIGALLIFLALAVTTFLIASDNNIIPNGWFMAGTNPAEYEVSIDNTTFQNGNSSVYLKSKSPKEKDFGTLMQTISADNYLGKRLKLSGYLKSENVEKSSGMWMRIDGHNKEQLGFDNMTGREIKGNTDWQKCEIVLDIPSNSKSISFGVLLAGNGKVWFDNFQLEEVDKSIATTNMILGKTLPSEPINLDFEN